VKEIKIKGKAIGDGKPCYILAEAGCYHDADINIARKLIDISVEAGGA